MVHDDPNREDLDFIKGIAAGDKRISLLINESNLGAGESRNRGIRAARGEFIAFLDADDVWYRDKLATQIGFMQKNNYSVSHTSYNIVDKNGAILSSRKAFDMTYAKLLNSCDIGLSTVIARKEVFNTDCQFPRLVRRQDYVLWLRITQTGTTIYGLDTTLSDWTKTDGSLSSPIIRKLIYGYLVYRRYLGFNPVKSLYHLLVLSLNYLRKK